MLALLRGSSCSCPMVRRIVKSKIEEYFHGTLGISTSRIREEFKRYLGQFVENINLYSTHSIKSGTATNPGCRNISGELLERHAGWRCTTSKQRYIKYFSNDLLQVSKALGV